MISAKKFILSQHHDSVVVCYDGIGGGPPLYLLTKWRKIPSNLRAYAAGPYDDVLVNDKWTKSKRRAARYTYAMAHELSELYQQIWTRYNSNIAGVEVINHKVVESVLSLN